MNLFLFTANFPFGKSEAFIENEINILSNKFNKVFIFPNCGKGNKRGIPDNVEVILLNEEYRRSVVLKSDLSLILSILIKENILKSCVKNNFRETLSYLLRLVFKSYLLNEWISKHNSNNTIYYSYWFDDWATILSVLKFKKIIPDFISRAHGFDLYDYRSDSEKIKFRKFQMENVKNVFTVSKDGESFLKRRFPKYSKKVLKSYLGTKDFGLSAFEPSKNLKILTISNINYLKRIHLLVEALKFVRINVEWTHFGDGELFDEINDLSNKLPKNIICHFMGHKSNTFLMDYIKNHHFDVFINLSKFEGLPVSIIEAISFGIPVFATDAGGSREIVNYSTGKLFKNNFKTEDLSASLNNFLQSEYSQFTFREGVRDFWLKNFDAKKNYEDFIVELKST
ncbi:MAG: glycosyltransferase [Flavobacteriaceae bacterium]|tara:strand:+ start:4017 stop:5207 length:1191 start_codon:yes stop_codon:yes gene_type:complete